MYLCPVHPVNPSAPKVSRAKNMKTTQLSSTHYAVLIVLARCISVWITLTLVLMAAVKHNRVSSLLFILSVVWLLQTPTETKQWKTLMTERPAVVSTDSRSIYESDEARPVAAAVSMLNPANHHQMFMSHGFPNLPLNFLNSSLVTMLPDYIGNITRQSQMWQLSSSITTFFHNHLDLYTYINCLFKYRQFLSLFLFICVHLTYTKNNTCTTWMINTFFYHQLNSMTFAWTSQLGDFLD